MSKKDDPDFDKKDIGEGKIKERGRKIKDNGGEEKEYYDKRSYSSRDYVEDGLEYRIAVLERQMKWLLGSSGLSLVILLGAMFWLGGMKSTVTSSSDKVDKMYQVALESKDSLASRTSVIETKLDAIDKKLTDLNTQTRPNQSK